MEQYIWAAQCVAGTILITKQKKIELNNEEVTNSITTVQKDNMVVENFYKPQTN